MGETSKERDSKVFNFRNLITEKDIKNVNEIEGVDIAFDRNRYGIDIYKGNKFNWPEVEENLKTLFEGIERR